tara:strand:+ start:648 stop:1223 length:576 start_codon:yes stop_codon:yes gene_type:complete
MEICKKFFLIIILFLSFINFSYAEQTFKQLENRKVSFLDFFLLKFENSINKSAQILKRQAVPTRIQYSNIGIGVNFDKNKEEIFIKMYAVMDRYRYSKKKYTPKLSDCNQVRNLIFYRKHGYKFFTQKRDPSLSVGLMEDIFEKNFFKNIDFSDKEIRFLMNKMYVNVTIFHPIKKIEVSCSGKVNDYELN